MSEELRQSVGQSSATSPKGHSGDTPSGPARAAPASYEFSGLRAQMYKEALTEYPKARRDDLGLMREHLGPRPGDRIIGFGEGSGQFCRAIAEAVGTSGKYLITEPSPELLFGLPASVLELPQVSTVVSPVETLELEPASFDKAWSCGAFHHCPDQTRAMAQIYRALKPGGRMAVFDIFQGTPVARFFDSFLARYCETGHEVKFMSEDFARSLCFLAGFDDRDVQIVDVPHRLSFESEWHMGNFMSKVFAMTRIPGGPEERITKTVRSLKECLPIDIDGGLHVIHFNQKGLIARK
jgi:arsenite methyltransferase